VPVKKFARDFGFTKLSDGEKEIRLQGAVHTLRLAKDSRVASLNDTVIVLSEPMRVEKKQWVLSAVDVQRTLRPLLLPSDSLRGQGFRTLVLDAGHGGADSGAVSAAGVMEKVVVLDITRRVRDHLLEKGHRVFLTRHDDRMLTLEERPRRAEQWKADLFVSIHANSGPAAARGIETFVLSLPGQLSSNQSPPTPAPALPSPGNRFDDANVALGYAIHRALTQGVSSPDRGLKRARFVVLKDAPAPAALVEVGFLSHAEEGASLARANERARIAAAIAAGIDNYLRAVKKAAMEADSSK
jgi:N-acetylmuramoyl-L-alanine amidase